MEDEAISEDDEENDDEENDDEEATDDVRYTTSEVAVIGVLTIFISSV